MNRAFRPKMLPTVALAVAIAIVATTGVPVTVQGAPAKASPRSAIFAWGDNQSGQLGLGVAPSDMLVHVAGLPPIVSIAGGGSFSLALTRAGTVWAWGNDDHGDLGIGRVAAVVRPVQVPGLHAIVAVAGGEQHGLALDKSGTVWAWGDNSYGERGTAGSTVSASPAPVKGLTNVTAIAAGGWRSLALRRDGTVWAWGANDSWQLGEPVEDTSGTPVQVDGLRNIVSIARGLGFSLALRRDGTVWAWGSDDNGQLGSMTQQTCGDKSQDLATPCIASPVPVRGLNSIIAVAASGGNSVALKRDGTVWTWGDNTDGQLGRGTNEDSSATPAPVRGVRNMVAIAAGNDSIIADFNLALRRDGTVWAWGNNSDGQLGIGNSTDSSVAVQVHGLGSVRAIAAGGTYALALQQDGSVWAWGDNSDGQLGAPSHQTCGSDMPYPCTRTPVRVPSLYGVTAIASGSESSLAIGSVSND